MRDKPEKRKDASRPGVLGDWTEEQNLNQPGNPEARIGEAEVKQAFGKSEEGDRDREKAPRSPNRR